MATFVSLKPRVARSAIGSCAMLGWAIVFAVLALVAGYLGFGAVGFAAAGIAKILFLIFLVLLVVSFIMRAVRGRSVV